MLADRGDQMQAARPAFVEEALGDVAPIRDDLAGQALGQVGDGLAIIDVAGCDPKRESLATVVDDEMERESEKPAHGVFTASGDRLAHLVAVDAAVVTDDPGGRIGEGDAGLGAVTGIERHTSRHQRTGTQGQKPRVAQQVVKFTTGVLAQGHQVKRLDGAVLGVMEND